MEVVALQQQLLQHANGNGAAVAAHLNTLTVVLLRAMCAEKGIALATLLLVFVIKKFHLFMTQMLHSGSFEILIEL